MAVGGLGPSGRARVAVQVGAQRRPLLVGHRREAQVDGLDPLESGDRGGDASLDLGLERTAGDGQRDQHVDGRERQRDLADHVEVDDGPMELGVLHGTQRLDDVGLGDGHGVEPSNREPKWQGRHR